MKEKKYSNKPFGAELIITYGIYSETHQLTINLGRFSSPASAEKFRDTLVKNNPNLLCILNIFRIS